MSRRDQIRMTPQEQRAFLAEQRVVTVASLGPNGRPHLMPLWFVVEARAADVGDRGVGAADAGARTTQGCRPSSRGPTAARRR